MSGRHSGMDDYKNENVSVNLAKPQTNDHDLNKKFDKIIDELLHNITHKIHKPHPDHDSGNKALNLDIDLINDTYTPSVPSLPSSMQTKIPANPVPNGTRQKTPTTKRPLGELSLSPNSPFMPTLRNKH